MNDELLFYFDVVSGILLLFMVWQLIRALMKTDKQMWLNLLWDVWQEIKAMPEPIDRYLAKLAKKWGSDG